MLTSYAHMRKRLEIYSLEMLENKYNNGQDPKIGSGSWKFLKIWDPE